jgi:hypothetical protein
MSYQVRQFVLTRSLLLGAMVLGGGAAHAGAGDLQTVVEPLQDNITYSSDGPPPLNVYLAYKVTIANVGGNTINNIVFTGATTVTDAAEKAEFASVEGASCATTNGDGTAIQCTIGQLKSGVGYPSFVVFFKSPKKVDNMVADAEGEDKVSFAGITYYAEGTGGVPQSPPDNSTRTWTASQIALGTFNPEVVRSAVQKTGGILFTGNGKSANAGDKFTTYVTVPAATTYTTAQIQESPLTGDPNCNSFALCWQTSLTIPGTFAPYLSVELTMDSSNIKSGTKIDNVVVQYIDGSNVLWDVGLCASPTTPRSDGVPCIADRVYFKNRSVPGWTTDLDGDFRWWLISTHNGTIRAK